VRWTSPKLCGVFMVSSPHKDADRARLQLRQLRAAMVARDPVDIEPLRTAIEAGLNVDAHELQPAIHMLSELEEHVLPYTFRDVPRASMERLSCSSREDAVQILSQCMGVSGESFVDEIGREFHVHNWLFCTQCGFTVEKASTFLSIMKAVHDLTFSPNPSETAARTLFQDILQRHSWHNPPESVGVFSNTDARQIRDFAEKTLFRHFQMYVFAYTEQEEISIKSAEDPLVHRTLPLYMKHEVDPREVPQLRDMFKDLAVGAHDVKTPEIESNIRGHTEIDEIFDSAIEAHLSLLQGRMELPI